MFMWSMFVHSTVAGVYRAWYGCCSLFGFFDVDFIFEGAIRSCYREFAFNPFTVDLRLVEFVFNPHFVELNFGLRKTGTSMADFAHKAAITGSIHLSTICEYDLYCHYVLRPLSHLLSLNKEGP